jgi:hypothetical protein
MQRPLRRGFSIPRRQDNCPSQPGLDLSPTRISCEFSVTLAASHGTVIVAAIFMIRTALDSRRLLRWILYRGASVVTCQIDRTLVDGSYTVSVVPHQDLAAAAIETYSTGVPAFQRHAAIVSELRRAGWKMAAYQVAA